MSESFMVTVPSTPCSHGKRWAKRLANVEERAQSGHGYSGEWLNPGALADLGLGDVVIVGGYVGSLKNGHKTIDCWVVGPEGRWLNWNFCEDDQWAMRIRQETRNLLAMTVRERVAWAAGEMLRCYPPSESDCEALRAIVAEFSTAPTEATSPLAHIADNDLLNECRRRGLLPNVA